MLNILPITSPNRDDRPADSVIDMLVLHYTGMQSGEEAISRLCDREAKVSAHYVVEEDGRIFQLVPEEDRAWHAGVSSWRGRESVNSNSIGIEIVNPGHEFGYRPFPEEQMQAVTALCQDILSRHAIPARNVVGHSDVAPDRKEDPGELFDWQRLAKAGVGLWPFCEEAGGGAWESDDVMQAMSFGDSGQVATLQRGLAAYGYPVQETGQYDAQTEKVVVAFQRHFRPGDIGGQWDAECQLRLEVLFNTLS